MSVSHTHPHGMTFEVYNFGMTSDLTASRPFDRAVWHACCRRLYHRPIHAYLRTQQLRPPRAAPECVVRGARPWWAVGGVGARGRVLIIRNQELG